VEERRERHVEAGPRAEVGGQRRPGPGTEHDAQREVTVLTLDADGRVGYAVAVDVAEAGHREAGLP
jgi:hypothetical protein